LKIVISLILPRCFQNHNEDSYV